MTDWTITAETEAQKAALVHGLFLVPESAEAYGWAQEEAETFLKSDDVGPVVQRLVDEAFDAMEDDA